MRKFLGLIAFVFIGASVVNAMAADTLRASLIGSWKMTSVYDEFPDGTRRNTWGPDPQGLLVITAEGLFSVIIVGGDRAIKPGSLPTEPVGPAIAYYGTFSVDEASRSFTSKVSQSTFPQWRGLALTRRVADLTETHLSVVASPITDANGRQFVPHLEFERVK